MSNNTIADLRDELFVALRSIDNKSKPEDIERARAKAEIGQVIINSAKVEVEFVKAAGGKGSGFFPAGPALPAPKNNGGAGALPNGATVVDQRPGVTVTRHQLPG